MCASSIVIYPRSILADVNKIIKPIAVTISGFIIGILFTFNSHSRSTFLLFESPIAVIVPRIVDINVAIKAIDTETYTAERMLLSVTSFSYHLKEKPEKLVSDFEELKEKNIVTNIGR